MESLQGKVAIVTGSTSGIGLAIATAFAERGASVVVNSRSSVAAGEATAKALNGAVYVQADISDENQCRTLIDTTIGRFGRLDVLVNNAGTTVSIPHTDLDSADAAVWHQIFDVNVFGTWLLSRMAVPELSKHHGSILNVTSLAGLRAVGSSIPYATSKAAVNHMTVLLAKALGPTVRVNAIAPGLIDTPWTETWDAQRSAIQKSAPMKRSGVPADVVEMAVALTLSDYITGAIVPIDGGVGLVI